MCSLIVDKSNSHDQTSAHTGAVAAAGRLALRTRLTAPEHGMACAAVFFPRPAPHPAARPVATHCVPATPGVSNFT